MSLTNLAPGQPPGLMFLLKPTVYLLILELGPGLAKPGFRCRAVAGMFKPAHKGVDFTHQTQLIKILRTDRCVEVEKS